MKVEARQPPNELVLDPFGYVPDMASRIGGLGGPAIDPSSDYAFHTPYVDVAEGVAHFTILFEGLSATKGTLNLRVHMLSDDTPYARLATAERVALNRLIVLGGQYQLRFEGFRGVTYALYGGIVGDSDARADMLRVVLDRPADPDERRDGAAEARDTQYHGEAVAAPHLVSLAPPLLAAPVTQIATAAQLKEKAAREWVSRLDGEGAAPLDRWRAAYVLQALRTYGVAAVGARGLGLDYRSGPVAAALAELGVSVDVMVASDEGDVDLAAARTALGGERDFAVGATTIEPIASDLVNYDFLWSDGACRRLGSADAGVRFIEAALACLRPGGFAVHVVDYVADNDYGTSPVFGRAHVERICLILISRGHEVAEFRIHDRGLLDDGRGVTACGILCRKALLSG